MLDNSGFASDILIGKIQNVQVQVTHEPDNRTVTLELETYGNFSTSKRDKLERQLSDLKDAIASNIISRCICREVASDDQTSCEVAYIGSPSCQSMRRWRVLETRSHGGRRQ